MLEIPMKHGLSRKEHTAYVLIWNFLDTLVKNQQDIEEDFQGIVNENFWDLI